MNLNILNGDSTLFNFQKSGLDGDTIVWREMLSEGPVAARLSYDEFFVMRRQWISETLGEPFSLYESKVVSEFKRFTEIISNLRSGELILWFEFDLFCQVNLIFLLDYLSGRRRNWKVSLICPDSHPNHPNFKGIGELRPDEFEDLRLQKVQLDDQDLRIASKAWEAYCSGDVTKIRDFIASDHHHLTTLRKAFEAHLNRFPDDKTRLGGIERSLIEIVNSGIADKEDIYQEFWRANAIYGMGDTQIDMYLDKLQKRKIIHLKDN